MDCECNGKHSNDEQVNIELNCCAFIDTSTSRAPPPLCAAVRAVAAEIRSREASLRGAGEIAVASIRAGARGARRRGPGGNAWSSRGGGTP